MRLQIILDIDVAGDATAKQVVEEIATAFNSGTSIEHYHDDSYTYLGQLEHAEFTIIHEPSLVK